MFRVCSPGCVCFVVLKHPHTMLVDARLHPPAGFGFVGGLGSRHSRPIFGNLGGDCHLCETKLALSIDDPKVDGLCISTNV